MDGAASRIDTPGLFSSPIICPEARSALERENESFFLRAGNVPKHILRRPMRLSITILLVASIAMSFFFSAADAISFGNFGNLGQKVTQKLAKPTFTPTLQTCDVALG